MSDYHFKLFPFYHRFTRLAFDHIIKLYATPYATTGYFKHRNSAALTPRTDLLLGNMDTLLCGALPTAFENVSDYVHLKTPHTTRYNNSNGCLKFRQASLSCSNRDDQVI
jgi:hypothetical protein